MVTRLLNYLTKYSLLHDNQFGFRPGRSTCDAVLRLVDFIYNSLNAKKHTLSILVDLRKAFDTVPHSILLSKFERYGIRGLPLQWFRSYLSNRTQRVKVNRCLSNSGDVNCCVFQGSHI